MRFGADVLGEIAEARQQEGTEEGDHEAAEGEGLEAGPGGVAQQGESYR